MIDVVPAAQTVLIRFDPRLTTAEEVRAAIQKLPPAGTDSSETPVLTVPTVYDGPDLDRVGEILSLSRDELVWWHTTCEWYVAFSGFSPGFGYLVSDAHETPVPRLTTPRTQVPKGSVALAGLYTGIYPTSSPGGWQIIGRTEASLFDLNESPPSQLIPGRRVRFTELSRPTSQAATPAGTSGAAL